jgi:hypothetical protein
MMECAVSHAGFEGSQGVVPVGCGEEDVRRSWEGGGGGKGGRGGGGRERRVGVAGMAASKRVLKLCLCVRERVHMYMCV